VLKSINIKNYKKIVSIILLIITMFSAVQPVLAASGSSNFVAGQFASYYFTTDNDHTQYGIIIRKVYDRNTKEWKTVFCSEHGIDIATGEVHKGTYFTPTDPKLKYACKIAYFGCMKNTAIILLMVEYQPKERNNMPLLKNIFGNI